MLRVFFSVGCILFFKYINEVSKFHMHIKNLNVSNIFSSIETLSLLKMLCICHRKTVVCVYAKAKADISTFN